MTPSQWNSWDTQTATGLVTLRQGSDRAVVMWRQTAVHCRHFLEGKAVWRRAAEWRSTTRCSRLRRNCYTWERFWNISDSVPTSPFSATQWGCAAHCAESWTGERQGTGSENTMVVRGCSREDSKSSRLLRRETRLTWERKYCR